MEKLVALVDKFLNGECEIELDKDTFSYSPDDNLITIAYTEDEEVDNSLWKQFLKENFNFNLSNKNLFTMAVLHEFGHYLTCEEFPQEQWDEEATEIPIQNLDGDERKIAYYNLPIEKRASEMAVALYNDYDKKTIKKWNKRFVKEIKKYERKNKIKSSLLTRI